MTKSLASQLAFGDHACRRWLPVTLALTAFASAEPATADNATLSAGVAPDGGSIVVEAHGVQPKAPLFFSATAENVVHLGESEVTGEMKIKLHVLQGHPEVLTLGPRRRRRGCGCDGRRVAGLGGAAGRGPRPEAISRSAAGAGAGQAGAEGSGCDHPYAGEKPESREAERADC